MRHHKKGRKLSRQRNQRRALLKILAANLILKEKITTTQAKAKELRPFIEKLITKSKSAKISQSQSVSATDRVTAGQGNNLALFRYLARYLPVKARKKLIAEIGPRFQKRAGGYCRIIKLGTRKTDGAKMALIELVERQ